MSKFDLPGLEVDKQGIRIKHPAADTIRFLTALGAWKPLDTSAGEQTVFTGTTPGKPTRLKANLWSLGCEALVKKGLRLKLTTLRAPFLSWNEGSVDEGVPTPAVKWVVVSFRDSQPPIALGFEDGPTSVEVKGKSGAWQIETDRAYAGWIRIAAPLGTRAFRTNNAAELGRMLQLVRPALNAIGEPTPKLLSRKVVDDGLGITVSWTFDRPLAAVPSPVFLAPIGGYSLTARSKLVVTPGFTEQGPIVLSEAKTLSVRFPMRVFPDGRPVLVGTAPTEVPATISSLDETGVTDLASALMMGWSDLQMFASARQTTAAFLDEAHYEIEPHTGQKLPFGESQGLSVVAANAWLAQIAQPELTEPNALYQSLAMRLDPYTWTVGHVDASAYCSLVPCLFSTAEERLEGALLQAGLAARPGLATWLKRRSITIEPDTKSPFRHLRETFYGSVNRAAPELLNAFRSPVRIRGREGVTATESEGTVVLAFSANSVQPRRLELLCDTDAIFEPDENVAALNVEGMFGEYRLMVVPSIPGSYSIRVQRPGWARRLPTIPKIER